VTDTLSPLSGIDAAAPKGLGGRMAGVILSPGETYRSIVAHPRIFGVLAITTILMAAATFIFLSTEVGQNAAIDQQIRVMESLRINLPDEAWDRIESQASRGRYFALAGILVTVPMICTVVAGIIILVFNVALGGDATFKQAYAVVAHSQVLLALQQLFILPLNYARESLSRACSAGSTSSGYGGW
jgi:Yip1-like protein